VSEQVKSEVRIQVGTVELIRHDACSLGGARHACKPNGVLVFGVAGKRELEFVSGLF